MKHAFPLLTALFLSLEIFGQAPDLKIIIDNRIDTSFTFERKIKRNGVLSKKRTLTEIHSYNEQGYIESERFYENNIIRWERHYNYYPNNYTKSYTDIVKHDTVITAFEKDECPGGIIITGGLPGGDHRLEYYPNGLKKSETTYRNNRYYLREFEYHIR